MRLDEQAIVKLRQQRSWTQDDLAGAAKLNLRTIQRIESGGFASLRSAKAVASALDVSIHKLELNRRVSDALFEYKTVKMSSNNGLFQQGGPDIAGVLNEAAQGGWRFRQIVKQGADMGMGMPSMVAIFERSLEAE